jgi:hypothetical protein
MVELLKMARREVKVVAHPMSTCQDSMLLKKGNERKAAYRRERGSKILRGLAAV